MSRDVIVLLARGCRFLLVTARCRDHTPAALIGGTEHGLGRHRFGASVAGGGDLFGGFLPPGRDQAPAHWDELWAIGALIWGAPANLVRHCALFPIRPNISANYSARRRNRPQAEHWHRDIVTIRIDGNVRSIRTPAGTAING